MLEIIKANSNYTIKQILKDNWLFNIAGLPVIAI